MKVNDWSSIQTIFDKLQKQVEKTMKSANLPTTPRQFIHLLCDLEAFLNETLSNRDVKKKMSPTNARALNTTKQRLRKLLPEYDEAMARWREDPVYTEDEEDSEEDVSDEEGDDDDEGDKDEDGKRGDKRKDELLTMDPEKITYEMVSKKAKDVAQARGRRSTIRQEQLEMLQFLIKISKGPVQKLEVHLCISPCEGCSCDGTAVTDVLLMLGLTAEDYDSSLKRVVCHRTNKQKNAVSDIQTASEKL
jgi:translation initiation factor 3 subunit C